MRMKIVNIGLMTIVFVTLFGVGARTANAELSVDQAVRILAARTNHYITGRGYFLSDDNMGFFVESYREAGEFVAQQKPEEQPAGMFRATESFRLLVDVMILEAEENPNYYYSNRLGENTLSEALSALCPLWPFCD